MDISIDTMEGHDFEYWCANLLRKSGFSNVRVTQGSGDQGVDVLAERDGMKYAVQCKRYNQPVGNKAVQEVFAGKAMYGCNVAVVITNNYFTDSAKSLARKTNVQLWDRSKVFEMAKAAGIFTEKKETMNQSEQKTWNIGCLPKVIKWFFIICVISGIARSCGGKPSESNQDKSLQEPSSVSSPLPASSSEEESISIWASEYTPLDEFEYYIDDDGIHLKDCNSESKKIWVSAVYTYEGRELPVASMERGAYFHSVDSIIISEGITKINNSVFNGCGVKYLYFPSTLTNFTGWSYFHDGEKLYYGGTKEQWNELFTWKRSHLEFVEIVCNASLDELLENG